tara:strand:+ start:346 stop:1071 length:726 start_codon:yes stop_codon:yes gene_type:complete
MEMKMPTEEVTLPSGGKLYPQESPLSSGKVEVKYMSAREEDILSNQSYIENGTVLDKLIQSVIIGDVKVNDLLIGDKNALMVAIRALGYGADYTFQYGGEDHTIDLTSLKPKELSEEFNKAEENEFSITLPKSENIVTFKLLTGSDEKKIEQELKGLKKIIKEGAPTVTTRLKHQITSINGDRDSKSIREFVEKYLLAQDSRAIREKIRNLTPDIDLKFYPEGREEGVDIPIGISFFWPDI